MPKTALSIAAAIVLLAIFAPSALAAPTANFSFSSGTLRTGVPITFTSSSTAPTGSTITAQQWDFNNDGTVDATGAEVEVTFVNPGTRQVKLTVTSSEAMDNTASVTKPVTVLTRPPTVDFGFSPAIPFAFDDVLFAPVASDPDGDNLTYSWDFDDGTAASTQHTPIHNFDLPGTYSVKLTVSDGHAFGSKSVTHDVTVAARTVPGNQLPIAKFAFSPRTPEVGDAVEFVSSSTDPEGQLRDETWDLDGDGEFDDGRGDDVIYTYTSAGPRTVRLRATDAAGGTSISQRPLVVDNAPPAPPGYLHPSPHVSFRGLILRKGMRMQALGVRGPRGALVTVRCKGKSCPVKQRRKKIKKSSVRFRSFERFMRGGVRLEFFVTKPGKIGTYRRYTIRAGKPPAIRDRCVNGTKLRPVKC